MIGHVDDDHLVGLPQLLADADELVRLHGEAVEADVAGADAHIGELEKSTKKKSFIIGTL